MEIRLLDNLDPKTHEIRQLITKKMRVDCHTLLYIAMFCVLKRRLIIVYAGHVEAYRAGDPRGRGLSCAEAQG